MPLALALLLPRLFQKCRQFPGLLLLQGFPSWCKSLCRESVAVHAAYPNRKDAKALKGLGRLRGCFKGAHAVLEVRGVLIPSVLATCAAVCPADLHSTGSRVPVLASAVDFCGLALFVLDLKSESPHPPQKITLKKVFLERGWV